MQVRDERFWIGAGWGLVAILIMSVVEGAFLLFGTENMREAMPIVLAARVIARVAGIGPALNRDVGRIGVGPRPLHGEDLFVLLGHGIESPRLRAAIHENQRHRADCQKEQKEEAANNNEKHPDETPKPRPFLLLAGLKRNRRRYRWQRRWHRGLKRLCDG